MKSRFFGGVALLSLLPLTAAFSAPQAWDPGGYDFGKPDYSPSGAVSDTAMKTRNEAEQALKEAQSDAKAAGVISKATGINPTLPSSPGEVAALYQQVQSLYQQFEAYQALAKQDKQQEPQVDANGGPGLPVHCETLDQQALAAQDQAKKDWVTGKKPPPAQNADAGQCMPCYTAAEAKINRQRVNFERLRIALVYTTKLATQGENALSGFGAAGGSLATMEAQAQIRKVDAALADFYVAYDGKYKELLAALKVGLDDFEVCETKYFNNPDWYNRFGFLYYQFLADKYKR